MRTKEIDIAKMRSRETGSCRERMRARVIESEKSQQERASKREQKTVRARVRDPPNLSQPLSVS